MQRIAIGMDIVTVKLIVDFEYMTRIIMPLYTLFQKQFYFQRRTKEKEEARTEGEIDITSQKGEIQCDA